MSYVTIPCLAIYTVYSLLYETHRGWYSFVISTLTSFVYMFGFVSYPRSSHAHEWELNDPIFHQAQLVPQLIINYKLKVRHACTLYVSRDRELTTRRRVSPTCR